MGKALLAVFKGVFGPLTSRIHRRYPSPNKTVLHVASFDGTAQGASESGSKVYRVGLDGLREVAS